MPPAEIAETHSSAAPLPMLVICISRLYPP
jgi:hypothetical protein